MKTLRRFYYPETLYFITVVTFRRRPFLLEDTQLFWNAWKDTDVIAWVILPDHFHAIVNNHNKAISEIMHRFKIHYYHGMKKKQEKPIWQKRFWEHIVRDEVDLSRHLDYIHFNPVKHGLIRNPHLYRHSSLEEFVSKGFYEPSWGLDIHVYGTFGE